jgi:hypothetical protein
MMLVHHLAAGYLDMACRQCRRRLLGQDVMLLLLHERGDLLPQM